MTTSGDEWTIVGTYTNDWTYQHAHDIDGPVIIRSQSGWGRPSFSEVNGCKGRTPSEAVAKYMEVRDIAGRYVD